MYCIILILIITNAYANHCSCNTPIKTHHIPTPIVQSTQQLQKIDYSKVKISINQVRASFSLEELEKTYSDKIQQRKQYEHTKDTIYSLFGPQIYDIIYPNYIYCTNFKNEDSCLEIEGCSWCNWPHGHCQYTYTAELYPTQNYCIDGGYPLTILPAVICGTPFSRGFTNCEIPAAAAI